MPTVSRSVERVFQVIELFGQRRRPLSTTEIREALDMPHSSAVSLLSRLVALGHLEQNPGCRRYYPSLRLKRLCESLPDGISRGSLPARVVDAVYERSGETTSLSRLCDLFTLPVYVHTAAYPGAHRVTPGCNAGLATQSVTGQVLLSLKSDDDLLYLIQRSEFWARRARVAVRQSEAQVMNTVAQVRETGYLCAFDQLLPGVGVVAYPLPTEAGGEAMTITVAGPTDTIRRKSGDIIETLREELERQYHQPALATFDIVG